MCVDAQPAANECFLIKLTFRSCKKWLMRHHQRTTGRVYGDYGDDNRPLALNSISGACFSSTASSICIENWKSDSQERVSDSTELEGACDIRSASAWSDVQRSRVCGKFNFRDGVFGWSVDEPSSRLEKIQIRCSPEIGLTLRPFQKGSAFFLVFFVSPVTPPHR